MRKVSLTSFIDYVLKAGTSKRTVAKKIHRELTEPYKHQEDYYKQLKEALRDGLEQNDLEKSLETAVRSISKNKIQNYEALRDGILTAIKSKHRTGYFAPKKLKFSRNGVEVSLNPEIGLRLKDKQTIIKLYTKADKLSSDRIGTLLCMMRMTYPTTYQLAILDCRQGKFYEYHDKMEELDDLLNAELAGLKTFLEGFDKH
jgi:hypothetical protein